MKTEPESYSIHDLERDGRTGWDGVRNYQARNSMQAMKVGDKVLVYHSNAKPSGVAGVAKVVRTAYPDPTAFDRRDHHFDPKSNPETPTWFQVDLGHVRTFPEVVSLEALKAAPQLSGLLLTSGKAMRLSVQPVDKRHFDAIVAMAGR
jgi:predicted RNA-binding protein with PUA-like domain